MKRAGIPDRAPFELIFCGFTGAMHKIYQRETGSDLPPEEYFDFDTRYLNPEPSCKKTDFSRYFQELEPNVTFNEWGVGSVPTRYEMPDHKYHPLAGMETAAEVNAFDWPDFDADYRYTEVARKTREHQARGYAVCGQMAQTVFETAWLMRGMETFMMDLLVNEEMAHAVCENITRIRIKQAENYARAGIDVLLLGDDIVTQQGCMMSPEVYREFIKPRLARIIAAAKAVNPEIIIFMHSCGRIEPMIEDLIEAGIDALHPVQPECNDLKKVKETYGTRLSFWGGIGVQSVLPHGTPDEVRKTVRDTIALMGKDGGFLVAPAHLLDPAIPWANVLALIDACKNQK
jgi:uroporphyrinogen decarboxylase